MAIPSMTLIQTQTVGAGGATFLEFTNIPQTFTDLQVVLSARNGGSGTAATDSLQVQFNSSTTGYTVKSLFNISGTVYTASNLTNSIFSNGGDSTANTFGNTNIYIPNYTAVAPKSWSVESVCEQNLSTGIWLNMSANTWATSAAVTSLKIISLNNFAFQQGTTVSLYGISKTVSTSGSAKATGGTITAYGGYIYHTFTGSGTFTPTTSLTADVLVIAGGAGGGKSDRSGGGGGAGGVLSFANQSLTATNYTVTVGGGGAASAGNGLPGTSGTNSTFTGLTTVVGGGYGGGGAGATGGSGGGGSHGAAGGSATSGQGFAGASGYDGGYPGNDGNYFMGGGGGGAGSAGTAGQTNNTTSGTGGSGINLSVWAAATSTGVSGFYAGGGAGARQIGGSPSIGSGGSGGGGGTTFGSNGTANTGSGGGAGTGGNAGNQPAGSGGSGLVIVRYLG